MTTVLPRSAVERAVADLFARSGAALAPREAIVGAPSGPDWTRCDALPAELPGRVRDLAALQNGPPEVAASFLLSWYASAVCGPVIAAYARAGRFPLAEPRRTWVRTRVPGWFDALAVDGPRLVTPGAEALPAALAEGAVALVAPVVEVLRAEVRLGPPALWGTVAAACGRTFLQVANGPGANGPAAGGPAAVLAAAHAFFDAFAAQVPPHGRPEWREVTHGDGTHLTMRQRSCCLAFRIGAGYCTTCPFTSDADRARRIREQLDSASRS